MEKIIIFSFLAFFSIRASSSNPIYEEWYCDFGKTESMRFDGTLDTKINSVKNIALCVSICWQRNQQGKTCKAANYYQEKKMCELYKDTPYENPYYSADEKSLFLLPQNCEAPGSPNPIPLNNNNTNNIRPGSCGQTSVSRKKTNRIVNGNESKRHSIPWIVSLRPQVTGGHHCGGSLIRVRPDKEESDIVLTATHCMARIGRPYNIVAGAHYRNREVDGQDKVLVVKEEDHPKWNDPNSFANDITILKLERPIKFTNTIQPVCLPEKNEDLPVGTNGIVAGWGRLGEDQAFSNALMEVTVPLIDTKSCKSMYEKLNMPVVPDVQICASYPEGKRDSCNGDSGGPYFFNGKQGYTLQGIVSWGEGCARADAPGVYVRVTKMVDWIKERIQVLSDVYKS